MTLRVCASTLPVSVSNIESKVEEVTVFARGARVRRVTRVAAPLPPVVRIGGLPISVIEGTVRAEVQGAAVVTMLRTGVATPGGETRAEETAELRMARRRVALADSESDRLRMALDRLAAASVVEEDPSDEPPAPWHAVVAARRALVALRAERTLKLREQLAAARHELEDARRAFEVVSERDRRASSARAARLHEVRTYVELELAAQPDAGDIVIHVEYQVAAARWAPSYVARLGDDGDARFELRAVVAQDTGEDWDDIALRLSTAEPEQFALLPELHPQKIGRRQSEPARRGFRAPPAGAEALYADYDHRFARPRLSETIFDDMITPESEAALSDEVWDEDSSRAKDAYKSAPRPMPPPAPQQAPAPAMKPLSAPMPRAKGAAFGGAIVGAVAGAVSAPFALAANEIAKRKSAPGAGGGMPRDNALAVAPAATPRLDYGNLRMAAAASPARGKLVAAPPAIEAEVQQRVAEAQAAIEQLRLPPGHVADWAHSYDYAFASDGKVDVASDGAWHSLALTSRQGTARIRHVAVPREQNDVFRVAAIANPFEGPLLPGPIDVYDRGQFLVTSEVDYTPSGGSVDVGLGVDPQVKIARNVEFHEEAAGMLRGALKLFHAITIDVENLSARPIDLEVRERVPVTREGDDDIEVTVGKVEPGWERWTPDPDAPKEARLRGAYRWKVQVAPRTKQLLRAAYEVKIANKLELVGGNRREP